MNNNEYLEKLLVEQEYKIENYQKQIEIYRNKMDALIDVHREISYSIQGQLNCSVRDKYIDYPKRDTAKANKP